MKNLMTVEQFGKRIGVGRATAYRFVAAREIDTTDIALKGRPRLRITEDALKRFIARREGRAA